MPHGCILRMCIATTDHCLYSVSNVIANQFTIEIKTSLARHF